MAIVQIRFETPPREYNSVILPKYKTYNNILYCISTFVSIPAKFSNKLHFTGCRLRNPKRMNARATHRDRSTLFEYFKAVCGQTRS